MISSLSHSEVVAWSGNGICLGIAVAGVWDWPGFWDIIWAKVSGVSLELLQSLRSSYVIVGRLKASIGSYI